jgi:cytochrome P450/NADPH-cytochrome P450 reductase
MESATIPGPPGLPILGNLSDIDAENPIQSLWYVTFGYEVGDCRYTTV